jgi:hypothetical protein
MEIGGIQWDEKTAIIKVGYYKPVQNEQQYSLMKQTF